MRRIHGKYSPMTCVGFRLHSASIPGIGDISSTSAPAGKIQKDKKGRKLEGQVCRAKQCLICKPPTFSYCHMKAKVSTGTAYATRSSKVENVGGR